MHRRRKSNFERIAEIDEERETSEEVSGGVRVEMACPATVGNTRYPETCVVDVDPGRWPEWLKPFLGFLRRLQTTPEENFGFVTDSYSAFNITAQVADRPGDGSYLYRRLLKAAQASGWSVSVEGGRRAFSAYAPPS